MAQSYDPFVSTQGSSWSDQARDLGQRALDESVETATAMRDTVKDHPTATLAVIGGLAFAIGALWMVGRSRQQPPSLLGRLSDLQGQLPRRWRA